MEGEGKGLMEGEGKGLIEGMWWGLVAVSWPSLVMSFSLCIPVVGLFLCAPIVAPSFPVRIIVSSSCVVVAHRFCMWLSCRMNSDE